jgi:hypothetical protein
LWITPEADVSESDSYKSHTCTAPQSNAESNAKHTNAEHTHHHAERTNAEHTNAEHTNAEHTNTSARTFASSQPDTCTANPVTTTVTAADEFDPAANEPNVDSNGQYPQVFTAADASNVRTAESQW